MLYFREFFTHRLIVFLMAVIAVYAAAFFVTGGGRLIWLMFPIGIAVFGISEYVTHRYLLHEFPKLFPKAYEGHVAHHEHPTDTAHLFGPISYDLITYAAITAIVAALTRSVHMTSALLLGASICQLYYQWKHYVSHRPIKPITPWGRWMKKQHLLHHYLDGNYWFGVSHPFLDYLLRTNPDKQAVRKASGNSRGQSM